ncbi:MAG: beta-hydroxyacyl-ACP dehydratase [Acidobacteria bacterium]|nr:beta-hydroxyacyl-ACP dehydratase [Acidobacteriota bacterium]
MSWLSSLPHQIPFRAATTARIVDAKTIEGRYFISANDPLPREVMLVESMAQLGGGLAFHETRGHGFLTGIDRCEVVSMLEPGDVVDVVVTLEAEFGGIFRFNGTASVAGVERGRARFYLASPDAQSR